MDVNESTPPLHPGWYIELKGHPFDLEDWEAVLKYPFEPFAARCKFGNLLLTSAEFGECESHEEVLEKGLSIIGRVNGFMIASHGASPVTPGHVTYVRPDGGYHHYVVQTETISARSRVSAVLVTTNGARDPEPSAMSTAQRWNEIAAKNADVADMLEELGRANGWYEIYKTIELASAVSKGQHKLEDLLGDKKKDFKDVKATANFYRHARTPRPKVMTEIGEAKRILVETVKVVMAKVERDANPTVVP